LLSNSVETSIAQNLFDGLYRYNGRMQEQPDIAQGMPGVSADGLTYTFHLRHDVRFSNGDKVTATDFIYSWNRAVVLQGFWSGIFQPVVGFDALSQSGEVNDSTHLDLSARDPYTLVAHLAAPSGYWITELVLPAAWVVDQKAVANSPDRWWTTSSGLIGTGPFRMTEWTSDGELDFARVANWWDRSTGALTRVEVHLTTPNEAWTGYMNGQYDVVGFGHPPLVATDVQNIAQFRDNAAHRSEVHSWSFGTTSSLGFNLQSGPFSGFGQGRKLRQAFSQAIDRKKLADAICGARTLCVGATGGMISKGLDGYLGDGLDPGGQFDPSAARAIVRGIDPDGKLLQGLTFYYPIMSYDPTAARAGNLASQWSANLGVTVAAKPLDRETFFSNSANGKFAIWRQGWEADYNSPQDWFDNLYLSAAGDGAETIYDRPDFAALIVSADMKAPVDALPDYLAAGRMLASDYAYGALLYLVRTVVIKPYVQGYGANILWEDTWTSLRILQH
jgi:oligopeptide transport system substrate-binding protein